MGLLKITNEYYGTDVLINCIAFLKRNCNAKVKVAEKYRDFYIYKIEGEGIPEGNKFFSLRIKEIVKNVYSITIEHK